MHDLTTQESWLLPGLFVCPSVNFLLGPLFSKKTWLGIDLAVSLAASGRWLCDGDSTRRVHPQRRRIYGVPTRLASEHGTSRFLLGVSVIQQPWVLF